MEFLNIEKRQGSIDTYTTPSIGEYVGKMVASPKIASSKTDNILWSFYSLVNNPESNYEGFVRRCGSNCKMIYAICLDYDGGATIDEVCASLSTYEYYMYTSFRHLFDAKTHKFRIILPLDKPYDCNLLRSKAVKDYMVSLFPGCDESTFAMSRTFYMPAKDINAPERYRYHINTGIKYSMDDKLFVSMIDAENKMIAECKERYVVGGDIAPLIANHQRKVKDAVDGSRNNTYWKSVYALSQQGLDGSKIYNTLKNHIDPAMDSELFSMCKRFMIQNDEY